MDENKKSNHKYASKSRATPNAIKQSKNGTLTVNNHTFSGIWAMTSPKKQSGSKPFGDDEDADERKEDEEVKKEAVMVHSLFENKLSQHSNNLYAYSIAPKYSLIPMDHDQQ